MGRMTLVLLLLLLLVVGGLFFFSSQADPVAQTTIEHPVSLDQANEAAADAQ